MTGHGFKIAEALGGFLAIMRDGEVGAIPPEAIRRRMLVDAASTATTAFAGLALGYEQANSWLPWTRAKGRRLIASSLRDLAEAGVATYAFFDAQRRARPGATLDLRTFKDIPATEARARGGIVSPKGPYVVGEHGPELRVSPFPVESVSDLVVGDGPEAVVIDFASAYPNSRPAGFPGTMTEAEARKLSRRRFGFAATLDLPEGMTFTAEETEAGRFPDAAGVVSPNRGAVVPGDEPSEIARLAGSFGDPDALAVVRGAGLQSDGLSPT